MDIGAPPSFAIGSPAVGCEWMADLTPAEREKLPQTLVKRKKVADEILSTEVTYVQMLNVVIEKFLDPLKHERRGCTQEEIFKMFSNIQVIRDCHVRLRDSIDKALTTWNDNSGLGHIFQATAWIKFYKYYVNNYDTSMSTLKSSRDKNVEFCKYVDSLNYSPALFGLNLEGLLIAPVQRIPRYVLLLNDMLKSTSKAHPDHKALAEALASIKELADYINEHKHNSDNISELTEIQSKWADFPGQLSQNPKRKLIKNGPVVINKEKTLVWLFNDIAVVTTAEMKKNLYKYKKTVNLMTTSLQPDEGNKFRLVSMDGVLKCQAQTPQEKEIWEKGFNEALAQARDSMIQSLFQDRAYAESEGSKKFLELKDAENEKKRATLVHSLAEKEHEYVAYLTKTFSTFLLPIKKTVDSPAPMVKQAIAEAICNNFETLLSSHKQFEIDVNNRIAEWEQNATICDLFEKNPTFLSNYSVYVSHHGEQLKAFTTALTSQSFGFWIRDVESREKADIKVLLEAPLRRVSVYYLLTQEMLQNTSRKHSDYEPLNKLVSQLRVLTDELAKLTAEISNPVPVTGKIGTLRRSKSTATTKKT